MCVGIAMFFDSSRANASDALSFNLNGQQIQSFGIEYFRREIGSDEEIVFEFLRQDLN